jgi:diguanylate cyclase (GGDEF)-like protein
MYKLALVTIIVAIISLWQQTLSIYNQNGLSLPNFTTSNLISMGCTMFMVIAVSILLWRNLQEVKRASRLAFIDELTGLPNRRRFDARLQERVRQLKRTGESFGLLYLDLDKFKSINDSYGHEAGDVVVRQFAQRAQAVIGPDDLLARLSGDEFAIILDSAISHQDLEQAAERIFHTMGEPIHANANLIYTGVSIGATLADRTNMGAVDILRHADFALLQAKENGRNNLQIFDPSMAERVLIRGVLENDLREAIISQRFQIRYQPLISQADNKVIGVEALVRWIHPTRGPIAPSVFIPIAEDLGLIDRLGEIVLRRACTEIRDFGPVRLAVNISPSQFVQDGFVDRVKRILEETGFDPNHLELEITEGVFVDAPEKTARIVHQFRALGVRIALDDFGTGYSSMYYLRDHALDRIKIDRAFVSDIGNSVRSMNLVSKLIDLGGSLGLNVTVEGVETEDQLNLLSDSGCEMQGFLFSHPVSLDQLRDYCADDMTPSFAQPEERRAAG